MRAPLQSATIRLRLQSCPLILTLAVKLRLAIRPEELTWSILAAESILTGIGFTMALFIAELAFGSDVIDSVKLGIFACPITSAAARGHVCAGKADCA